MPAGQRRIPMLNKLFQTFFFTFPCLLFGTHWTGVYWGFYTLCLRNPRVPFLSLHKSLDFDIVLRLCSHDTFYNCHTIDPHVLEYICLAFFPNDSRYNYHTLAIILYTQLWKSLHGFSYNYDISHPISQYICHCYNHGEF